MDHAPGTTHEALPLDPEHDIDARSATMWVIGGTVVLFASLWLMLPIFLRVLQHEQIRKVNESPTTERYDVHDAELEFLSGANPSKRSIEDVLKTLRK